MFRKLGMFDRSLGMFQPPGSIPFQPGQLFLAGEQGVWYDPSDFSTMYQDSAGTTPVTAIEQPVGLILDKSGRGNHASQPTTTSRPILRNRYNLLTYTEQFDNAYWGPNGATPTPTSEVTTPEGTTTAYILTESTAFAYHCFGVDILSLLPVGGSFKLSIRAKYKSRQYFLINLFGGPSAASSVVFDIQNGTIASTFTQGTGYTATGSITPLGSGWYECAMTCTIGSGGNTGNYRYINFGHSDSSTLAVSNYGLSSYLGTGAQTYIDKASLVVANEAHLPYQWVTTGAQSTSNPVSTVTAGYDTDVTKFPPYLFFDGTDDWLQTGNINFSATDKMSVFAGVRKLSDTALNVVTELSATIASNNGTFLLSAPNSAAANYNFSSKGTSQVDNTVTTYSAPITNVVTGLANISAPSNTIRVNGTATTVTTSQGAGNYGSAYPLYIGRRGGTTNPLNGRIYSLIIRGALTSFPQLEQTERWVAGKTGVTL